MKSITQELVSFLTALGPGDLAPELVARLKRLLLDYLGCAIRGSQSESSLPIQSMARSLGETGPCTIIGTALRAPHGMAALANGAAAHSVELDDTHQAGSIHLGVVMFSAAIALSERLPEVDAARFFAAVLAGYEAAARLGMAVDPKDHYALGFHPTATCGVFGAAITASKLLGLDEERTLSAFGIAGSMAAGSLEFLAEGAWTKRLHPGLAAQNGMQAAFLAAHGFRGPARILEGRDGFLRGYSRRANPELVTHALGATFEILRTSVKPHACCRYMQAPIDALIALAVENDIHPRQVRRIEVAVLEAGWPLVAEPRERKYNPRSVVDAQFSMPFGAAVAILFRGAGLDQFTEQNAARPEIRELMGKVVLTKDNRIEQHFPEEWRARVEIHLDGERRFEREIRHPKGDPENPLTADELGAKFRALAGPVLGAARCAEIESWVCGLGLASGLGSGWRLLAAS